MSADVHHAWLANIRLHPIKGLDPVSVPEARIGPNGGLELDRVWALFSVDGAWINGKRTAAIHHLRAERSVSVDVQPAASQSEIDQVQPGRVFQAAPAWAAKRLTALRSPRPQKSSPSSNGNPRRDQCLQTRHWW